MLSQHDKQKNNGFCNWIEQTKIQQTSWFIWHYVGMKKLPLNFLLIFLEFLSKERLNFFKIDSVGNCFQSILIRSYT